MELEILHNIQLDRYSSIKAGGTAEHLAHPETMEQLHDLLLWAEKQTLPVTILGGCSNTLISDTGITGLVIDTKRLKKVHVRGVLLTSYCGTTMEKAISVSAEYGLSGLEVFSGLPGTIGGAVYGNVGCFGHEIAEYIEWVEYLHHDGTLHRLYREQHRFDYRDSPFKHNPWIITEVCFNLAPKAALAVQETAKNYRQRRRDMGHYTHPSMGSIFKNPIDPVTGDRISAGKLIEEAGLIGHSVGSATVATYHGNIIINPKGESNADDIYRLIHYIRACIQRTYGISLELEINMLGSWEHISTD